jgi:cell division protein FtsX
MTLSFSLFLSDEENLKRFAAEAPTAKTQKASKKPTKKVVNVRSSGRLKKASDARATLEAHQSTSSSDDVHKHTVIFTSIFAR